MFPKSLLNVSRRKGKVYPKFLTVSEHKEVAKKVLAIFQSFEGKKYKYLKKALKQFEHRVNDYKVVRGLSTLLERKASFNSPYEVESEEVRKFLFEHGIVTSDNRRNEILSEASESFGLPPAKIEDAMFADLPKEQILEEFKEPSPDSLLKLYNLSLIQTILMNSLELIITLDSHYQQIFRFINYLGLMYRTDGKKIEITGPLSIFRKTRKYGKEIAKLVPIILRSKSWELKAKIELKYGSEAKIYDFILSSHDNGPLFKNNGDEEKDINVEPFDSGVEERFYKKFQNFNTGWKIKREPTFIKTGAYVTIPDFGFYKYEKEILLEVVGFWTPEYLKKKIEKLNKADQRIIAAVNKKLNCTREDFPGEVIFYTKEIPIKPILKILQEEENKVINRERKELENLTFTDDIVLVKEKARELSVTEQTIKSIKIPGYQLIKEKFISDSFLKKLKTEIGSKRDYPEVKKILDKYSISNSVLDVLGFKIIWDGLAPIKIR